MLRRDTDVRRCHRWLGGMLTNYKTVKQSIKRLEEKSAVLENGEASGFNKKELLDMTREVEKLDFARRRIGDTVDDLWGLSDAFDLFEEK